jgi:hypothetical protein
MGETMGAKQTCQERNRLVTHIHRQSLPIRRRRTASKQFQLHRTWTNGSTGHQHLLGELRKDADLLPPSQPGRSPTAEGGFVNLQSRTFEPPAQQRPAWQDRRPDRASTVAARALGRSRHLQAGIDKQNNRSAGLPQPQSRAGRTRDATDSGPLRSRYDGFFVVELYDHRRPHSSLGYVTPIEFAARCAASAPAAATPQPALQQHSGDYLTQPS